MRTALAGIAALVAAAGAPAQQAQAPRLLVVISIDDLSPQLMAEYRTQLTGGLSRLAADPSASGQIEQLSPGNHVVVSGSAAPAATGAANQHWRWNGQTFAADSAGGVATRSVVLVNGAIRKLIGAVEPPLVPPAYCATKASSGGNRFARAAGDYGTFSRSPSLDGATLALAAGLVQDLRLGRASTPDILTVDLAATGQVGVAYGSASEEMCLQLFALDRELQDFFRALDRMRVGYTVAMKAPAAP